MWRIAYGIEKREALARAHASVARPAEPGASAARLEQRGRRQRFGWRRFRWRIDRHLLARNRRRYARANLVKIHAVVIRIGARIDKTGFDENCLFSRIIEKIEIAAVFRATIRKTRRASDVGRVLSRKLFLCIIR